MRSSSRPSISEISFSRGSSAVAAVADQTAVAQDRDAVRDPVNLVEEMGDEDDRDSAALEVAQDLEKQLDLIGVEARGRLVEHEHPRVVLERARDRDELLDRQRIGAERPLDVDVDLEPLEPLASEARAPRARK